LLFLVKSYTFQRSNAVCLFWWSQLLRACTTVFGLVASLYALLATPLLSQTRLTISSNVDVSRALQRAALSHGVAKRPKVALVLSGGGARGVAQIGVLRALEAHGIPIDFICGTSFGAIIGGLYAAGYTVAELESLALHTNWDEVLSLTEETNRTQLFLDQKAADDRSFLVVRFQGLTPVIPPAVSSGQRLTDFVSNLTLQALYHSHPSFDDLKIPFRCVATDLVSGRRVVIKEGSLWEALRATATVPLLFSPVEKDSMQLVDGGLVSNIPVDVARDEGYDIVIAVNSTSGLRPADEMTAPWQTADQIMGIMMQLSNKRELEQADIVITPDVGGHLASDFSGLDSLIAEGERAGGQSIPAIQRLIDQQWAVVESHDTLLVWNPAIAVRQGDMPDSMVALLRSLPSPPALSGADIVRRLRALYDLGAYKEVTAEVVRDSLQPQVIYTAVDNPVLRSVRAEGCAIIPASAIETLFAPQIGQRMNFGRLRDAFEQVLRLYRARGYSLAVIDSAVMEGTSGTLLLVMNEGIIRSIEVAGGVRTRDEFVLQDFPLAAGNVFQIDKARNGVAAISGSKLFEYVYLDVSFADGSPTLTIRLRERPSQLVRFGFRGDNERGAQGSIDIRDENFRGSGLELGLSVFGGGRNQDAQLEYRARRLFETTLSLHVAAFYSAKDSYLYADAPKMQENHWDRIRIGEYSTIRSGGKVAFGNQLERLGIATVEYSLQDIRVKDRANAASIEEHYRLALLRFGTVVDTKNSYPFPTEGIGFVQCPSCDVRVLHHLERSAHLPSKDHVGFCRPDHASGAAVQARRA
jgi:NTE family protein